jgi:hypothetical protein
MRRPISIWLLAVSSAVIMLPGVAAADSSFTTRIETRPYYGAVTTLEHGVRVIRPLPPTRYVIVNPNRTPLALGFNETNVYDYSSSSDGARYGSENLGAYNEDGPIYTYPSFPKRFHRGKRGFSRHFKGHRGNFAGGSHGKGVPGAIGAH